MVIPPGAMLNKAATRKTPSGPRQLRRQAAGAQVSSLRPPTAGDRWREWLLCLLLAAVVFAVYFPALSHPFVIFDDVDYVTQNRQVQQGLTPATFRWALTSLQYSNWHPLTWISHALDCEIFGLDPGGHHFTNLLLHAINAVLIFLLLLRITRKAGRSLLVAALFALHPINVENVAWVAERKTLLSMMFMLLALGAYVRYARKPGIGRHLAVDFLFLLALAAKPMVVTFPFILLLMDFWPLHRIAGWRSPSAELALPQFPPVQLLKEKLPLFALSAGSCVITLIAQHRAMQTIEAVPLRYRVANAIFSYVMYLWKAVWPVHLSFFYARQGSRLAIWQVALCLAFLAAVSALVWWQRSRPYLPFGWLWFLGTLVPMIGIVQVGEQGMADRYAYLPLLGFFVAAVWGVGDLAAIRAVEIRWSATAACAVLVLLCFLTRRQLRTWESSYALCLHSLKITPENNVAEDFVGATLMEQAFKATGQKCSDEALVHFQNAVRINPKDSLAHINVGFCREAHGDLHAAIAEYQTALQVAHNQFLKKRALLNLGGAYRVFGDFSSARQSYDEVLKIDPADKDALRGLAKVELGETLADQ